MGELLKLGLDKVSPPVVMSEREHKLQIVSAQCKVSSNDKPFISLSMSSITEPKADKTYDQLWLPAEGDDDSKIEGKKRRIIAFCENFNVTIVGGDLDPDSLVGSTGFATIKRRKDDSGQLRADISGYTGGK